MAASLQARGAAASGQQPNGKAIQYQLNATDGNADGTANSGVGPYDSGNILGHVQPGGSGKKLVDGTIQRATDLICDSTAGVVGNALQPTAGVGVTPTKPSAQGQENGLSLGPEFE
jgi:hypothetical protein